MRVAEVARSESRPARRTTTSGILAAVAGVAVVLLLVSVLLPAATEWLSILTGAAAAAVCVHAALRTGGRMRPAWLLFSLLVGMYAAGDFLWLVFANVDGAPQVLSFADALYLLALVPATLGLLVYPVLAAQPGQWRPVVLDATVLALAVASLSYSISLRSVFAASEGFSDALVLAVYPLTDGILMALALVSLLRSVGRQRVDVALITVTFGIYAVADNAYALAMLDDGVLSPWVDYLYMVAPLTLAGAAVVAAHTPTPPRAVRLNLRGLAAPLLPDLTALVALIFIVARGGSRSVAIGLLVAVGIRQISQTRAFQDLRIKLETRVEERGRELEELAAHYKQLESLKFDFITSVSHELRTPLTAIRGSLEMLHDGDAGPLGPQASSVVEVAMRGSERLTRLVNDIIDLERLESGAFGLRPAPTPLRSLAEDAMASLEPLARERGVALVVDEPREVWASCDPDRVTQVLINLLANALKFAPRGTEVTTSIREEQDRACVSVADQGRGIPPEELAAVFGRFHQVSPQDDTRHGGTGLGLAICEGIVTAHGGRIWAENDGGAVFSFTLPLAPVPQPSQPLEPSARSE